ncbi:MAG: serine/threonine-protein kinase, partial [Myxococcota bacterium]
MTVGNHELQELLDQGAMGKVYVAVHKGLGRKVALKLQKERRPSPRNRERMLREARLLARLEHPNVVRVLDVGEHEGRVYLTMELVEGKTLGQLQADAGLGWSTLLRLYIGAGRGLAAAHAAGLVHRDFKPDNVIVDQQQRPRVLDFGLACATEESEAFGDV